MKILQTTALASLLALTSVGVAVADDGYIVRVQPSAAKAFAAQFGRLAKDISNGNGVFLVRLPNLPTSGQALKSHPLVQGSENNGRVALPEATDSAANFSLQADPKHQGKLGTPVS